MYDSWLRRSIAIPLRVLFVLSVGITCFGYGTLLSPDHWAIKAWAFAQPPAYTISVGVIPHIALILGCYLYEGRCIAPRWTFSFWVRSFLVFSVCALPPAAVVTDHALSPTARSWLNGAAIGIVSVLFLNVLHAKRVARPSSNQASVAIADHMYGLLCRAWRPDASRGPFVTDLAFDEVFQARRRHYHEKEHLTVFQSTTTCHVLDADCAADLVPGHYGPAAVSILDIGCGEGTFVQRLITRLNQRSTSVRCLTGIDPCDWAAEYRNPDLLALAPSVEFRRTNLEEFDTSDRYDIVLASHSLYAYCDQISSDPAQIQARVVNRLLSLTRRPGVVLIVLASRAGIAYRFKRDALAICVGRKIADTTAEVLERGVLQVALEKLQSRMVDNVFDLTNLFASYAEGDRGPMLSWISYFLRIDMARMPADGQRIIVELLRAYSCHLESLPQLNACCLRSRIPHLHDKSIVLPHKTYVFCMALPS